MYLKLQRDGETLEAELAGSWRGADLSAIDEELAATPVAGARRIVVSVPPSVVLDIAGAWRLREWLREAEKADTARASCVRHGASMPRSRR